MVSQLSIGGPKFIENTEHPVNAQLNSVGREITSTMKPKAILLFSAHWQVHKDKIAINTAGNPGLIYDFYNFPKHYYGVEYPNRGGPEVAESVASSLEKAGIRVAKVERGLDHGVWVGVLAGQSSRRDNHGRWRPQR